jgi:hypothetical protein
MEAFRQDHGRGNNRTGQGTPAGLINAGDAGEAVIAGTAFEYEQI